MMNPEAEAKVREILAVLEQDSAIPAHDKAFILARCSYLNAEQLKLAQEAQVIGEEAKPPEGDGDKPESPAEPEQAAPKKGKKKAE